MIAPFNARRTLSAVLWLGPQSGVVKATARQSGFGLLQRLLAVFVIFAFFLPGAQSQVLLDTSFAEAIDLGNIRIRQLNGSRASPQVFLGTGDQGNGANRVDTASFAYVDGANSLEIAYAAATDTLTVTLSDPGGGLADATATYPNFSTATNPGAPARTIADINAVRISVTNRDVNGDIGLQGLVAQGVPLGDLPGTGPLTGTLTFTIGLPTAPIAGGDFLLTANLVRTGTFRNSAELTRIDIGLSVVALGVVQKDSLGTGRGSVTSSSPPGLACSADCDEITVSFEPVAPILLVATPETGDDVFRGWSSGPLDDGGRCSPTDPLDPMLTIDVSSSGFRFDCIALFDLADISPPAPSPAPEAIPVRTPATLLGCILGLLWIACLRLGRAREPRRA